MRTITAIILLVGFLLIACLGGAVGSGVVVLAAESSSSPSTADIGVLRGPAVPESWRVIETDSAATCPRIPWSILGALGWIVDESGRRSLAGSPPWWPWPGGAFGIVLAHSRRQPQTLSDQATAAIHDLCAAVEATGGLAPALTAITGQVKWATEIMGVATALETTPSLSAGRAGVIDFATRAIGLPYQWGGNGPGTYDCSGLVVAAFRSIGRQLPRTAQEQFDGATLRQGTEIPGDLVFFGSSSNDVSHVGIVLGDGLMIDAPHTGAFVRVEPHNWSDLLGIATVPA